MTEPRIIQIGAATIEMWPDFLRTVYRLEVPAAGNDDAESIAQAAELGYDSTFAMSLDHELIHSLVAQQRGEPFSRVLFGVAYRSIGGCKEQIVSPLTSWQEECLILDAQKYMNTGKVGPVLAAANLDLDALKARLREVTSG